MKLLFIKHSMLQQRMIKLLSDTKIRKQCQRFYSIRTHYDILNVKKDCTNGDIRQSFAKLSKMYHPDTCKSGTEEQNSRKFQEIVEAYKILGKKSSRDAYDYEISSGQQYSNYNETPYRRDRQFYESDFERWQHHMYNMKNNKYYYYRTQRPTCDNGPWNPTTVLKNKKTIYTFLIALVFVNIFTVYVVYMMSRRNMFSDFESSRRKILYETHRHGYQPHLHYKPAQNDDDN